MFTLSSRMVCALALGLGLAGGAYAQWQWVDDSGRKVFSDTPPPTSIPQNRILKQPKAVTPAPVARSSNQDAQEGQEGQDGQQAQAQPGQGEDADLKARVEAQNNAEQQARAKEVEDTKKQNEEIDRKNAEIERQNAQARANNCNSARQRLQQLEPGRRVTTTDGQGNTGYMSDAQREAERQRAQQSIRDNC